MNVVVKVFYLAVIAGIDACGETELDIVGEAHPFFQRFDFLDRDKGDKQFIAKDAMVGRQVVHDGVGVTAHTDSAEPVSARKLSARADTRR